MKRLKDIDDYSRISEIKSKCKICNCTKLLSQKVPKAICHNCGNYVFLNDEEEFKYRLKEQMLKNKTK